MQKEQKLKYINELIKEMGGWGIIAPRVVITNFIEKAQIQIAKIMGPQSPYIKEIDVFNTGKEAVDYDINLKNVLKKIRFDIDSEEERDSAVSNNIPSEKVVEQGKIFISHSSKDSDLVREFIERILVLGLEIKKEDVFCTSLDGTGIKSGEDFKKAILEELRKAKAVIQIITKNYKTSEICLNEMGAAWITQSIVIPIVADSFNYDVGFIHASSQQLRINEESGLIKLYDDHKESLFKAGINTANYLKQIKSFLGFLEKNVEKVDLKKKFSFFYHEKNRVSGKLYSDIFGHPPGKYEDSKSFHRFYYIIPETSIDVLSSEMFIKQGDFNVSKFNIEKIQIVPANPEERISLKQLESQKTLFTPFQIGRNYL